MNFPLVIWVINNINTCGMYCAIFFSEIKAHMLEGVLSEMKKKKMFMTLEIL